MGTPDIPLAPGPRLVKSPPRRRNRWKVAAIILASASALLAAALGASWLWFLHLALSVPQTTPAAVRPKVLAPGPVTPLLLQYKLDLPGRGEIFPALSPRARDYWPVAILTIANSSERPVLQVVRARVADWTDTLQRSIIVAPGETRVLRLSPRLLPRAYENNEVRRASLDVTVSGEHGDVTFADTRPVLVHSGSDLYWGNKFANAQFIARWVTPHDPAVLKLVSEARKYAPRGRLAGYNLPSRSGGNPAAQARMQAEAVFRALQHSGLTYVSSIYTFGDYVGQAQRIRLPRETLSLKSANCIDVSVVFASAMENLDMEPVIVIIPGHAYAGLRLRPGSDDYLYLDLTVLPKGSFQQAIARAAHFRKRTPDDQVLTVDIVAARKLGIYPLPTDSVASGPLPKNPANQE